MLHWLYEEYTAFKIPMRDFLSSKDDSGNDMH